jgi:pyruvate dehydrogenase E2 component (dihydrolipoamide acetyltransferase)
MSEIMMPKLSDSMEQGTILSWLKADGDTIEAGEELVEIETDKAAATYEAEVSGVLQILVPEGESIAVGQPIAIAGAEAAATAAVDHATATVSSAGQGHVASVASSTPQETAKQDGQAIKATPLARRVASAHGVRLEEVVGTGPLGRVTRGDVLTKAGVTEKPSPVPVMASRPQATANVAAQPSTASGNGELQALTAVQQVIARRMLEAKATAPHFQVQTDVAMDAAIALRNQFKALPGEGIVPSLNDIIVKASALSLRAFPLANASYTDAGFELHEQINIGVAVAADGALVVPTIFDADTKSLGQLGSDSRTAAQRVRSGQITPAELSGGTFTVSNLGMFGMTAITPVINVPQAAILGVGAVRPVLAREDGEIVDRALLTLTLSCDHRILYGADAARFLAHIKQLLESPLSLAL